jgi:hypothetical protein
LELFEHRLAKIKDSLEEAKRKNQEDLRQIRASKSSLSVGDSPIDQPSQYFDLEDISELTLSPVPSTSNIVQLPTTQSQTEELIKSLQDSLSNFNPKSNFEPRSEMSSKDKMKDPGTSSGIDPTGRPLKDSWMELSDAAREALKGDKNKLRLHMFNKNAPEEFESWLTELEDYFRWSDITNPEAKINITMTKMDFITRDLMADVLKSARGYDWEKFKEDLIQQFPEAQDRKIGSRERLIALCEKTKYIPFGHHQKLMAFNREFNLESKKLKEMDPPLITNVDLVSLYINTLEPRFADELKKHLVARAMAETKKDTDIREKLKKRQDPWLLEDVQDAAITMSATMIQSVYSPGLGQSGRDTYVGLNAEGVARLHGVRQTEDQYPRQPIPEPKDKRVKDEWEQRVSTSMDTYNTKLRELGQQVTEQNKVTENTNRLLVEMMKVMKIGTMNGIQTNGNQYQRPCDKPRNGYENGTKSNWMDDLQCWFCSKKGHTAQDCPEQAALLESGILKRNNENKIELKDGSRLPYVKFGEPGPTRAEKVSVIAKEKGWLGKSSVTAQSLMYEVEDEPALQNFQYALEETIKEMNDSDESRVLEVLMKKLGGSKN